jgi:hypothetical protein
MATHYTLNSFVRQVSNGLLADYFEGQGIDLDIDIRSLKPRKFEPIIDAIGNLSDERREGLDRDFKEVTALGDKAGLQQIIDEARFREINLGPDFEGQFSFVNKVFWTFLKARPVFEAASRFAVPYLQGRYWKRHLRVTSAPGIDPSDTVASLEAALSRYFQKEEGRGKACKVEYQSRRPLHWFHAFPEDYPAAPLAWSGRDLAPHPFRPAFEVIFVYDEVEGSLDIYFEGGKKTVERLWQLFAVTVLGLERLPEPEKPVYNLEPLKSPDTAFVRPPGSPIIDVRIKGLTFAILGYRSTRFSIETDVAHDREAIHAMVDRTFARGSSELGRFSLSQAKVIRVKFQAMIDGGDGKKPRNKTFDLSAKTCSLKYEGADLLLRRMLVDSQIDRSGSLANAGTGPLR